MNKFLSYNSEALGSWPNIITLVLAVLILAMPVIAHHYLVVNWGFDNASFLLTGLYYLWIGFGLILIAFLFISPSRHFISVMLTRYLWGDRKIAGRLIILVIALIIFFIFRFEAHLYGNGYIRIANFAQRTKPIVQWYEAGATYLAGLLYWIISLFEVNQVTAAAWAYRLISFLSGLGFIYLTFRIANLAGDNIDEMTAYLFLVNFTGFSLFFFGFVENNPILLPLAAAFVLLVIMFSQRKSSKYLGYLWLIQMIGLFFSFQFITTIPAIIYLSFRYLIGNRQIGRFLGTLTAFIIILCGPIILYLKAVGNIGLENLLLFWNGKPPETIYTIFGFRHLMDLLNLFYLLIPAFIIFLGAIAAGLLIIRKDRIFVALSFVFLAQVIYIFVIDPKNGMARDIHLYGFLLTGLLFLGVYALIKVRPVIGLSKDILMMLCPISLLAVMPIYYVHLDPETAVARLDKYLAYNDTKYEAALLAMRDYYAVSTQPALAIQREQAIKAKAPGALESQIINDLYAHERYDDAFEYALQLVERNPYNAIYRMQKGNILKFYKRFGDAEKEYLTGLKLDPYNLDLYHFLSELYRETRQHEKSYAVLKKALSIDPRNPVILVDMAGYYYNTKQPAGVDSLTGLIFKIDSTEPYAYMYRGLSLERAGRKEAALKYLEKFVALNDRLPEVPVIRKKINDIFLELNDTTKTTPQP
nr:hypothetical protein [candidate division Zixibacteria bacterium]